MGPGVGSAGSFLFCEKVVDERLMASYIVEALLQFIRFGMRKTDKSTALIRLFDNYMRLCADL